MPKWTAYDSSRVAIVYFALSILSTRAPQILGSDPPCYFNPLCTCSKAVPDLGNVRCEDTPLSRIHPTINSSKVFMLHLNNVGLRSVEPHFLQGTGLYKLTIVNNPISIFPDDAFYGLERTLWRLDLSNNQLLYVPSKAVRYLKKLKHLDLSGNDIAIIFMDSWKGLEDSLEWLDLSDNSITQLAPDSFTGLPLLDTINLKGNQIHEVDASVFREGMNRLAHVILADNLLTAIPYLALSPLRMLKTLDLSYNRIGHMNPTIESGNIAIQIDVRMSLNILHLDYNDLKVLEGSAFQYFNILNRTYLDGNPIFSMEANAFQQAKIKELYIRDCDLTHVIPEAFNGLEKSLEVLDMSGNNITDLAEDFLLKLEYINSFKLSDNLLRHFNVIEITNGVPKKLFELDLSGARNEPIVLQTLKGFKNLRKLHLSRLSKNSLDMRDFYEFGMDLETLSINFGQINTIKNRAFENVHGLKRLDLSENHIQQIESEAFSDVGHTLKLLDLSHAFSSSVGSLPYECFKVFSNLYELDLSNNKLKSIPETSFHFLKKLKTLLLNDNEIETIKKGTFQEDIHLNLETIYLSFNNLATIQQHTFSDLKKLEQLHLDDNQINKLERRSFMDLEKLKRLNLKGNKISTLPYESFQNLPELEDLDISYNLLTDFQFAALDQVGTLATFRMNISHNKLQNLVPTRSYTMQLPDTGPEDINSNIKMLDLSYNNITYVGRSYFKPLEQSLTHLYLSHNKLLNASNDLLGNMLHLQLLDLSYNRILEFDYDVFKYTRYLQVVLLQNNLIAELPKDLFRSVLTLRIIDLSHNRLRYLPDNFIRQDDLERLDLSHNQLNRLPLSSFSMVAAASLCELDVSWNGITSISHAEIFSKLESLSFFDVSHNRLVQLDPGVFTMMPRISYLDLSYNTHLSLDRNGRSFQGIETSLLYLKLDNMTFLSVPELPLPCLVSLSLAHNSITNIPSEMTGNLTLLRTLNLASNKLAVVPVVAHSLNSLMNLSIAKNPINMLSNMSFMGLSSHLETLDITDLPLITFDTAALNKLVHLKTLRIGVYHNIQNFNIPKIISQNFALQNLEIQVERENDLQREMYGDLPPKLRQVIVSGRAMKRVSLDFMESIRSPRMHFIARNTGVSKLDFDPFGKSQYLRNITIELYDNYNLQNIDNPNINVYRPGLSSGTFLVDVSMNNNKWNCDCELGWMEVWQRKKRQYLCNSNLNILSPYRSEEYSCRHTDDDYRNSFCVNKGNRSLIDIFKTDIECGWSSASSEHQISAVAFFAVTCFSVVFIILSIVM